MRRLFIRQVLSREYGQRHHSCITALCPIYKSFYFLPTRDPSDSIRAAGTQLLLLFQTFEVKDRLSASGERTSRKPAASRQNPRFATRSYKSSPLSASSIPPRRNHPSPHCSIENAKPSPLRRQSPSGFPPQMQLASKTGKPSGAATFFCMETRSPRHNSLRSRSSKTIAWIMKTSQKP
jgi:hypothetical protein